MSIILQLHTVSHFTILRANLNIFCQLTAHLPPQGGLAISLSVVSQGSGFLHNIYQSPSLHYMCKSLLVHWFRISVPEGQNLIIFFSAMPTGSKTESQEIPTN